MISIFTSSKCWIALRCASRLPLGFEIIFGRRRHSACLKLGIPFLVIKKDLSDIREAIAFQDAENKFRKNVSNYSNAMLYKRLIDDNIFKSEKELATKLGLTTSTLNDLMAYGRIPKDIVNAIPDIHNLSNSMALKIVNLLSHQQKFHSTILQLAPEIGKTITSTAKLENLLGPKKLKSSQLYAAKVVMSQTGKTLFTYKRDHRGAPCFVLHQDLWNINHDDFCQHLQSYFDKILTAKSGYPDISELEKV